MADNVVQKLGRLDLSIGTCLKLVAVAIVVFLLIAAGRAGAARVQALAGRAVGKAKEVATGGTPVNAQDPRYAGI